MTPNTFMCFFCLNLIKPKPAAVLLNLAQNTGKQQAWLCPKISKSAFQYLWSSVINLLYLVFLVHTSVKTSNHCFTSGMAGRFLDLFRGAVRWVLVLWTELCFSCFQYYCYSSQPSLCLIVASYLPYRQERERASRPKAYFPDCWIFLIGRKHEGPPGSAGYKCCHLRVFV